MTFEDRHRDFLRARHTRVVRDPDQEVLAHVRVGGEVLDGALVDRRVGNLKVVAFEVHQDRAARRDALDDALLAVDFDRVAVTKRALQADQHAREEVLGDVPEREAEHDAQEPRATDDRHRDLRQPRDAQEQVHAEQPDGDEHELGDDRPQELALEATAQRSTDPQRHAPRDGGHQQHEQEARPESRQRHHERPPHPSKLVQRRREVPHRGPAHGHSVRDRDHAFGVARERDDPSPVGLVLDSSTEEDDALAHLELELAVALGRPEDLQQASPDRAVIEDGFDRNRTGRRREHGGQLLGRGPLERHEENEQIGS